MTEDRDTPTLDHVALRVADRAAATQELIDSFDLHIIEQTDRFTLVGAHEEHGKITLLDAAPGRPTTPRRIVSIVLAESSPVTPPPMLLREGVVVTFAPATGELDPSGDVPRHALVGLSLRSADPVAIAARLCSLRGVAAHATTPELAVIGFGDDGASRAGGRITLTKEQWADEAGDSMLDHIGLRVADAARWRRDAERAGFVESRWVEAPHSRAAFVVGPEQLSVEFVEQTAPFASV